MADKGGSSVIAALLGLIGGSAAAAIISGVSSASVEKQKFSYSIVQAALSSESADARVSKLRFLLTMGFVMDKDLKQRLETKLSSAEQQLAAEKSKQGQPPAEQTVDQILPQLPPQNAVAAPPPAPIAQVDGFAKFGVREPNGQSWSERLFNLEGKGVSVEPSSGDMATANSSTNIRSGYPTEKPDGLYYKPVVGVLPQGARVQIQEVKSFARKNGETHFWIHYELAP
jgi:hypothetical protein